MAIIVYHPSEFDGTLTILGTDYAVEGGVTTIDDSAAYQAHAFQCGFKTTPQTAAQLAASYGSTGPTRAGSVIFVAATSRCRSCSRRRLTAPTTRCWHAGRRR
jgi:hypothetical protein